MTNKCTKNKSHATHLGISARLTAITLTHLGDVSTVAKTLVEALNDVLQNLDATGSVDSSVVHAGKAQTLKTKCNIQNKVQCAKLSSLHPRSRPPHAHSTQNFQLISRHLVRKTGFETGTGIFSDYLVKLVIPASRAMLKPAVICRCVSLNLRVFIKE